MIKTGDTKNFIYMPHIGLIVAGDDANSAIQLINRAEVEKEISDKKVVRKMIKKYPNCNFMHIKTRQKSKWIVVPFE